jgi:hypothetical protein
MKVKVNMEYMDLSERLIENTRRLLESNNVNDCYGKLIDYNCQLFKECYDLDIFDFIPKDLVENYTNRWNKSNKYINSKGVFVE